MEASKVAVVTGGGRGIGRAISHRLAADGVMIVVNYARDEIAAEETVAAIARTGAAAFSMRADITDLSENRRLFESIIDRAGRLDILINCAGVGERSAFGDLGEAAYDRLFAITKGTYFAMQNAVRVMQDEGRIISLSTGLTRNWAVGAAAYAGSKAAIEQFGRSLSNEAGKRGITVNTVLPGVTRTDMTGQMPAALLEAARQQTSFGRLGEPEDIAEIVAFLASPGSRWITGQLIVANGGSTP